jgi:uroporphyrinogen decarboxylase
VTTPTLADAHRRFSGALVGGLAEGGVLRSGPPAAIAAQVADAIRQTSGIGLVVAPGCVLPLATPEAHLAAVIAAVHGAGAR